MKINSAEAMLKGITTMTAIFQVSYEVEPAISVFNSYARGIMNSIMEPPGLKPVARNYYQHSSNDDCIPALCNVSHSIAGLPLCPWVSKRLCKFTISRATAQYCATAIMSTVYMCLATQLTTTVILNICVKLRRGRGGWSGATKSCLKFLVHVYMKHYKYEIRIQEQL